MKISIITPSFNQGDFIEKTILSVINQSYKNIEYIIIDGGSTDQTIDVIKKHEDKISFWCSEKDNGQSHALNKGFARATGDVLAWINSDDYYENGAIAEVMDLFEHKDLQIVNGNCEMHNPSLNKHWLDRSGQVTTARMLRYWKPYFCPPQPSIFFLKSVLEKVGALDESLNFGMDLDLWLRMSLRYNFTFLDKTLSHYIIHEASKSGSKGGFSKFVPEWKKISFKYLGQSPLKVQLLFWKDYLKRFL